MLILKSLHCNKIRASCFKAGGSVVLDCGSTPGRFAVAQASAGVKGQYGDDSLQYEMVGGTFYTYSLLAKGRLHFYQVKLGFHSRFIWCQHQMSFRLGHYLVLVPGHRIVLNIRPHLGHINIVRMIGMTRLPCCVDSDRVLQIP